MKSFFSLAAGLTLATTTCAQATASLTALTPVGVLSTVGGSPTFFNAPVNAPLNAMNLSTYGTGNAGTRLLALVSSQPQYAAVRVDSTVSFVTGTPPSSAGTSPSTTAAGATLGAVEMLASFQAPPGTPARLTLRISQSLQQPPSGAIVNQASLDVGANGTIELTTPNGPVDLPLTIPASGQLVVKFTIDNHVTASGLLVSQTSAEAVLTLNPPALCHFLSMGFPCGGTVSGATEVTNGSMRTIALVATGCFPGMPVVSTFGSINGGPTLPGGCQLHNDAAILVPLIADATGVAVHTFTIPVTTLGALYHDFVPIDLATLTFRMSNGIGIYCVL